MKFGKFDWTLLTCRGINSKFILFVFIVYLLSVFTGCLCLSTSLSIDTYLTARDKEQLTNVLVTGLASENLPDVFYAVSGLKQLNQQIPNVQVSIF